MKVIITGAESTGKTTLAVGLSALHSAIYVPEYSRTYLSELGCDYDQNDLLNIAKGQVEAEDKHRENQDIVICDTSLIVIKVWSNYKYGNCDPWILDQIERQKWDVFFLPHYDIPYEFDPLRENPQDREELYHIYFSELCSLGVPFYVLRGTELQRLTYASNILKALQG